MLHFSGDYEFGAHFPGGKWGKMKFGAQKIDADFF
jgi:hypothetical protein